MRLLPGHDSTYISGVIQSRVRRALELQVQSAQHGLKAGQFWLGARGVVRPAVVVGEGFSQVDPFLSPERNTETVLFTRETEEPTNIKWTVSDEGECLVSPEPVGTEPAVELGQDSRKCLSAVNRLLLYPSQSSAEIGQAGVDQRLAVILTGVHHGPQVAVNKNPGKLDDLMRIVGDISLLAGRLEINNYKVVVSLSLLNYSNLLEHLVFKVIL